MHGIAGGKVEARARAPARFHDGYARFIAEGAHARLIRIAVSAPVRVIDDERRIAVLFGAVDVAARRKETAGEQEREDREQYFAFSIESLHNYLIMSAKGGEENT